MKIYKIAKVEENLDKLKMYKIFRIGHSREDSWIGATERRDGYKVMAYSPEQARMLAFKKWGDYLQDFIDMGYEIVARTDEDKLKQIAAYDELQRAKEERARYYD